MLFATFTLIGWNVYILNNPLTAIRAYADNARAQSLLLAEFEVQTFGVETRTKTFPQRWQTVKQGNPYGC